MLSPVQLENICPSGDLFRRSVLNFFRLHAEKFRFLALKSAVPQAPGDSIGRVILALTLLSRAIDLKPLYLNDIINNLHKMLNKDGYISVVPRHAKDIICEQEICGHNALLRGLCEYYILTKNTQVLDMAKNIIDHLIVPSGKAIGAYPSIDPKMIMDGEQVAMVSLTINKWRLSTDIACIFLVLDGMTQAYELLPTPALKETIENYIDRFGQMDFVAVNAQTYATLSALRGILRFYEPENPNNQKYLALVERTYALYKSTAWTENYANYNWFERPEWTEPCAVIDSFLLSVHLWRLTGNPAYLEDAHLIFYNALFAGQRPSGGFGCDLCVGANGNVFLKPHHSLYEADCCCTMRGSEGLSRAVEFSYFVENNMVTVPFYSDCTATLPFDDGNIILQQCSGYPYDGSLLLYVRNSTSKTEKTLKLYMPSWIVRDSIHVTVNGCKSEFVFKDSFLEITGALASHDCIHVRFSLSFRSEKTMNSSHMPDYHKFMYGPVVLGVKTDDEMDMGETDEFTNLGFGRFLHLKSGFSLEPANDLTHMGEEAKLHCKQLLFKTRTENMKI